ncbi:hypothetical protein A1355_15725 [Methylomonas koyamae]|uniref:Uncharacterized protein n=1 Tax=Methylomonas koyamae TaxID=702114 RepID=A0A177N2X5_9GAMM|nr:hypothetical protein A1355_15725 [Methylomonas koyamae]
MQTLFPCKRPRRLILIRLMSGRMYPLAKMIERKHHIKNAVLTRRFIENSEAFRKSFKQTIWRID